MQVDFYILEIANKQKSLHFACRLIEKAYAKEQRIYVHTASQEAAEYMDGLLWTYRDDSFLPHQLYQQTADERPPIQIGYGHIAEREQGVLVNLCQEIPGFYQQFKQVIEIVFADPLVQQLARERFRQYREKGGDMNTYKIKASEL